MTASEAEVRKVLSRHVDSGRITENDISDAVAALKEWAAEENAIITGFCVRTEAKHDFILGLGIEVVLPNGEITRNAKQIRESHGQA